MIPAETIQSTITSLEEILKDVEVFNTIKSDVVEYKKEKQRIKDDIDKLKNTYNNQRQEYISKIADIEVAADKKIKDLEEKYEMDIKNLHTSYEASLQELEAKQSPLRDLISHLEGQVKAKKEELQEMAAEELELSAKIQKARSQISSFLA